MTIHQSRYGGAAEVGRAPVQVRQKDSRRPLITISGAGLATGGGITATQANRRLSNLRASRSTANESRDAAERIWRNRKTPLDPNGIALRGHHAGLSPNKGGNLPLSEAKFSAFMDAKNKDAKNAHRAVNRMRSVRTAGLAALAAGLGIAGTSALQHEKSRGTIGYKRSADKSAPEIGRRYRYQNGM